VLAIFWEVRTCIKALPVSLDSESRTDESLDLCSSSKRENQASDHRLIKTSFAIITVTMGIPVVLPALVPDISKVYDVYFASFQHEGMASLMLDVMFPNGVANKPGFREEHAKGTLAWWHQADSQYTFKCIDNETGKIIGMALADVLLRERSEEERKFGGIPWLEGKDREKAEAVVGPLVEMREKLLGRHRHVCKYCPRYRTYAEYTPAGQLGYYEPTWRMRNNKVLTDWLCRRLPRDGRGAGIPGS